MINLEIDAIARIDSGYYSDEARELREALGEGATHVELSDATAEICNRLGFCVSGGAACIFEILEGHEGWRAPYEEWSREVDDPVIQREGWVAGVNRIRWKALFAYVEKREAAKTAPPAPVAAEAPAPKGRIITAITIEQLGACSSQVDLFRRTFGEEAEVTEENVRVAKAAGLQVGWLSGAYSLLSTVPLRARLREECDHYSRAVCPGNGAGECDCDYNHALIFARLYNEDAAPAAEEAAKEARTGTGE